MSTSDYVNKITTGNSLEVLRSMDDNSVDLTVTSPPYDNLRSYNGYSFDFEGLAQELFRVTKDGGIVVWVVGDATVKGSETLTSFKQAIYFKEVGFNVHDTMIYAKENPLPLQHNRYQPCFEYMFIFSKGKPSTFNPILIESRNPHSGGKKRLASGELTEFNSARGKKEKYRENIWFYAVGLGGTTRDKIAYNHPAIFPEKLAEDHIVTWSNSDDIVLDIFGGSGTTAKMAILNDRNFIHVDISEEYNEIARERIEKALADKASA
ncbi:DNA-methyltransferase [Priestia megaterium]|uniref:DNA-methyltransferase n=1 Tax=Priestia megaterium TaxID=1404 RepID=UPI003457F381